MPLTGVEIYKLLPKTNCRKCGFPTCLAFAMKLAAGQVELSACPELSPEARKALEDALRPTMRLVSIGKGEKKIDIGGETVMFRHEKAFLHPPGILIRIKDTSPLEEARRVVKEVAGYGVKRAGVNFALNGFALQNESGSPADFLKLVEMAAETELPLVLISSKLENLKMAAEKIAEFRPALYAATKENKDYMLSLAKDFDCPLVVRSSENLEELAELAEEAGKAGVEDLILDPGRRSLIDSLLDLTYIRRLAVRRGYRPLGFPVISFPGEGASSPEEEMILAGQHIIKYSSLIVLDNFLPSLVYPLLILRLNIYTDPQIPLSVEEGVYKIGNPDEKSPVLLCSNWALTYLLLSSAVEAANIPAFLCVKRIEEADVLCWCHHCLRGLQPGSLNPDEVGQFVKRCGIEEMVRHRKLIIPGRATRFKAELGQALPDWEIIVGPEDETRVEVSLPEFARRLG
ncbi:MAG: acetyl-CoA decarbonylase/synthase complex subunit gamma [Chloroflexi bacterium]|nr:MAG: acetyl-CoA decarbonylase/synthase complex subunit gamma [Chloroflexota bacterium]